MAALLILGLLFLGGFWLLFSLIGLIFKLTFGLFGMLFGAIGLAVAGVLWLVLLPIFGLLLLPFMLPLVMFGALIWWALREPRRTVVIAR